MSEKAEILENNQIPIDKEKLKEEYKTELKSITNAFEQKCLLSFSTNRSGEVIKKFDFPTFVSHEESQKEDRMIHQMNQAIGHAFVNHAPLMANHIHNVVIKTLQDRGIHLALWDRPINRPVRWSFLLLNRLLGYYRLTLKLRQMRMS